MPKQIQTYLPSKINRYCPACALAADAIDGEVTTVSFGAPAAASTAAILSAQTIAVALTQTTLLDYTSDATFGQNVTVVASGAATSTVTIRGRDFWGQPMMETLTLNGATPVVGVKAFYTLTSVAFTATAATTIDVGWGSKLGLPYKMIKALSEEADNAPATIGTLTAPVLTDPATATTGDPRGTYTPNTTANGAKVLTATFLVSAYVNAAGNGGLHGIQHFFS